MKQYSESHHASRYRLSYPNLLNAREQRGIEIKDLVDVAFELGAVERVEIEFRFGRVNESDVLLGSRGSGTRLGGAPTRVASFT